MIKLKQISHIVGLLILRLGVGVGMMTHGLSKYNNFNEIVTSGRFLDFLGLGIPLSLSLVIFSEIICSFAITLGFLTRIASFMLAFTMFIAIFVIHKEDPFNKGWELAFMYLLAYITLIFTGASTFSIDHFLFKKCQK